MSPGTVTGAELLRRALLREGAEVIFGHPGGAILPFYDALHDGGGPRHVLVRHEQAAAHAADGWARLTGRPGVCVATSGPGATNLVTGLATALMDGVPLVAVTGQVPATHLGTEAFQETDVLGVTMPVTKHGFLVERAEDLPALVAEAFRLALEGRPGPVVVDVPKDVQLAEVPAAARTAAVTTPQRRSPRRRAGHTSRVDGEPTTAGAAVAAALARLRTARRPVVMVGRGVVCSDTSGAVRAMAESAGLPVVATLLGVDAFPREHPLCLGLPGMHGSERANRALQEADVVVGFGLRFDDRVTGPAASFAPRAGIVHFDIDPRAHGRTLTPAVAVLGDLRETLPPFARGAAREYRTPAAWWARLGSWEREPDPRPGDDPDGTGALTGRGAARALARVLRREDAVVVTDVGQHQMWMAQELRAPDVGRHLTSGGLGTMGFALPAAMGAALARPDLQVWAVVGDGGFQMTLQELATLVQERIALRVVVMNNGHLGMVRQWQRRVHAERYVASSLAGPDLSALAAAYGIVGSRVETVPGLVEALDGAARSSGPVLLDLRIPPDDEVFPMVRPGAAIHETWTAPASAEAAR